MWTAAIVGGTLAWITYLALFGPPVKVRLSLWVYVFVCLLHVCVRVCVDVCAAFVRMSEQREPSMPGPLCTTVRRT